MTCKQASHLMATGAADVSPWTTRLVLRLHLLICRHCRAFARQLEALSAAARRVAAGTASGDDGPADLTEKIVRKTRL
jgi:hypothetical protein